MNNNEQNENKRKLGLTDLRLTPELMRAARKRIEEKEAKNALPVPVLWPIDDPIPDLEPDDGQTQKMNFKQKLYRSNVPLIFNGQAVCIGHLILMMHESVENNHEGCRQIHETLDQLFEKFDTHIPVDHMLPPHDLIFRYRFRASGVLGIPNAPGICE